MIGAVNAEALAEAVLAFEISACAIDILFVVTDAHCHICSLSAG